MINSFEDTKDRVALNIYNSMIDNYDPVPNYLLDNKEDILSFLKLAWIHGANWRLNQMLQNKNGLNYERRV
jgi:hypothetical protein